MHAYKPDVIELARAPTAAVVLDATACTGTVAADVILYAAASHTVALTARMLVQIPKHNNMTSTWRVRGT